MSKVEKIRKIYDKLPAKHKQVISKFVEGKTRTQMTLDLDIGSDALNHQIRELYRNFGIARNLGKYERKELALQNLCFQYMPELCTKSTLHNQNDSTQKFDVEKQLEDSIYTGRPPIKEYCYQAIEQPGALLRIKVPQGLGNTSLLTKVLHQSESRGDKKVRLS